MISKWTTAYSDGKAEYEAVQVPWDDVTALLGHSHEGSAADRSQDRGQARGRLATYVHRAGFFPARRRNNHGRNNG